MSLADWFVMQLVEMMLWFGTVRYVLHLERFNTLHGLDKFTGSMHSLFLLLAMRIAKSLSAFPIQAF